jgi:hypothetical protein
VTLAIYCLVFSVIFFIVGVIGVIPSFFAPLKIAEMKVCHPIPMIAKIMTTINIQVKRPIDGSAANLYFKNLGLLHGYSMGIVQVSS